MTGLAGKEFDLPPEIIDIRRFNPPDFSPLLEAETRAWSEELHWDFEASAHIITSCLREKRLAGYALAGAGAILGYCFFFCEGEKGLIGDLFVQPALGERESSALLLLEHVIETLQGTPGLRRIEAQLPHFGFETLEACFLTWGFQGFRRNFMAAPLSGSPSPDENSASAGATAQALDPATFRVIPWERRHDHDVAELLFLTYQNHVDARINDQYTSVAGAVRLVENIVRHHGCGEYLPQTSRLVIHRATEQLAGVLTITRVRPRTAHIPQVAVAEGFQGRGIGSALIGAAFRDLRDQGYEEVTLTVTESNGGAVRLYQRLGFRTFRTFGAFVYQHAE